MKPSFDSMTLACVTGGLQSLLGAQVQRLTVRPDLQIILSAYTESIGEKHWLFDVSPSWPRTHLTRSAPPKKSANPLSFESALRKYVLDGTIRRIAQRGFDRVLEIDIDGEHGAVQLIGEFIGNRSNLILCRTDENGEKIILHAAKLTNPKQKRQREILPGRVYQELERQGIDPRNYFQSYSEEAAATEESPQVPTHSIEIQGDLSTALVPRSDQDDVAKTEIPHEKVLFSAWLKSTFEGISPLLEKEILFLAHDNLQQGLRAVIEKTTNWNPGIYRDSDKNVVLAYPFEVQHLKSTFTWQPAKSIHEALETVYREAAPKVLLAQRKSTFEGIVKKSIQHREHALRQVQQGLGESGRAARHRRFGELLFAHMHDVPAGAESVTLQDFYEDKEVVIPSDKDLSPAENAARYFERAKHSEAGRAVLESRQNELETELRSDKVLLQRVLNANSLEELERINHEEVGLARRASRSGGLGETALPDKQSRFEGHRIKIFQSPEGYEILVGENATSNDYLVKRIMRPNDWWLHVRGNTSAHAVIPTNGNPQKVPQSTLLFAARQVAGRSAAKHAGYAAVDYTLGKYVRKPRKAAPGAVTYEREKTLHLMKEK
jgi:predicted ribosome quality control (RQC) complex YloA/Tae2 family protein